MNPRLLIGVLILLFAARQASAEASPAKPLAGIAREADTVIIRFLSPTGKNEIRFSDKAWIERLAKIIEAGSFTRKPPCACLPYPEITLYRGKERLQSLGIHNGAELVGNGSITGVFTIGDKTGKAIVSLAQEKSPGD